MRTRVVIEAKEEYLIDRKIIERKEIEKLSDDEVTELYWRIVEDKGLFDDAVVFTTTWCRNNR
ncbi:MAG: hypothetical protein IJ305_01570 [Oscillospiraceae bacterium]|nr:hypothetical protein [Oscillospiraceae bacterium]